MIPSDLLIIIDAIDEQGSFAAAAKALHRVPSAISYAVKRLEDELGFAIFERKERRVFLTEAGRYLLDEGRKILSQLNELKTSTQRIQAGYEKSLRVTVNHCTNHFSYLNTFIKAFRKANPHTELDITSEVYYGTWDAIFHNRTDLVIGAPEGMPVGSDLKCRFMGKLEWVFAISPQLEIAKKETALTNDELRKYPSLCIHDTARIFTPRFTWRLDHQNVIYVPNFYHVVDALVAGIGITYIPHFLATPYVERGELVIKKLKHPKPQSMHYLAWNPSVSGNALCWCLDFLGNEKKLSKNWL